MLGAYTPRVPRKLEPRKRARPKFTPWLKAVGARFRALRGDRQQSSFASLGGIQIGRFENGEAVHLSALEGLCDELGISPNLVFVPELALVAPVRVPGDDTSARNDAKKGRVAQKSTVVTSPGVHPGVMTSPVTAEPETAAGPLTRRGPGWCCQIKNCM